VKLANLNVTAEASSGSPEARSIAASHQNRSDFHEMDHTKFSKYAGLSLPQIILADADWFFWALNEGAFWGKPGEEAEDLAAKARAIKIPKPDPENWQVEYCFENNGRFVEFGFVKTDAPFHGVRVCAAKSAVPKMKSVEGRLGPGFDSLAFQKSIDSQKSEAVPESAVDGAPTSDV
jgi:hypothetical protein